MSHIYCGNNRNNPGLRSGKMTEGTRRICLRKGVGVGLSEPIDKDFGVPYAPITGRNLYCGDANQLPNGYDAFGNNAECLQIGVGIGKRMKFEKGIIIGDKFHYIVLFVIVYLISFLWMYLNQPSYVIKTKGEKKEIDWMKILLIPIPISIGVCLTAMALRVLA